MIKTKFKKFVIAKLFGITKIYNSFYIKTVKKWRMSGLIPLCLDSYLLFFLKSIALFNSTLNASNLKVGDVSLHGGPLRYE